jgi:hypothetical protein
MAKSTIQDVLAARVAFKTHVESFTGVSHKAFTSGVEPLLSSTDDVLTNYLSSTAAETALAAQIAAKLTPEDKAFINSKVSSANFVL